MEAGALPTRLTASRAPFSAAFLRLRSDEQLVAMFRAGSEEAFRAIHERYRGRLLAYTRQMLRGGGDSEDALQDVFLRAYRSLRGNDRPVALRAWLYRIAHNRCIDELRRPCPLPSELAADAEPAFGVAGATSEPAAVAERSAALACLVADVRTLPSQQRSALLMRELQGLSYEELASALAVSVPAIKSLLLRARTGLIDIAVARDTPCLEIRDELVGAADRGVRISGRARRHCGECSDCDGYRCELRRLRRSFAALAPSGPLTQLGMLFGIGGGGAAAAGGGGAAGAGGALAGATAAKIAVAVCCAALITTAGRAVIEAPSAPATRHALAASRIVTVSALPPDPPAVRPSSGRPSTPTAPSTSSPTVAPIAAAGATGATGATGVSGSGGAGAGLDPSGSATGSTGATGAASAPLGATGDTGTSADSGTAANGIGGSGSLAAATGATGATGDAGAPDAHYDIGRAGSPAGPTGQTGSAGASTSTQANSAAG